MKKRILMSLFTIAIVGALIGGGVMAIFTDSATNTNPNTFTAGTLDISLGNPGSWSGNFGNMKPGDTVIYTVTVQNDGSLPVNYTVTTALAGDLAGGGNPCVISLVKIDKDAATTPNTPGTLTVSGGGDGVDTIEVRITMPTAAGDWYQGRSGTITITVNATS